MALSKFEIEKAKSPIGGWTKEQLAAWGVPWPPPRGWRRRLESAIEKQEEIEAWTERMERDKCVSRSQPENVTPSSARVSAIARPEDTMPVVNRSTRQPSSTAVLYFTQSCSKPPPRL